VIFIGSELHPQNIYAANGVKHQPLKLANRLPSFDKSTVKFHYANLSLYPHLPELPYNYVYLFYLICDEL